MSTAAKPIRLAHGFWHVRLWEFLFLMIIGSLLFRALLLAGPDALLAMMVSNLVVVIKMDTGRIPWVERAYPSEFRWPYVGVFAAATLDFWQIGTQVGPNHRLAGDTHVLSIIVGSAGMVALAFLEVFSGRKAHGPSRDA